MTRRTLALATVSLTLVACDDELPSRWVTSPIVVDGQPDEWERIPLFHFEGRDFAFAVQNDADNLYVYFSTNSPRDQRLLGRLGATVWLDAGGDQEKTRGIRFWPTSARPPGRGVTELGDRPSEGDSAKLSRPPFQAVGNDTRTELEAEVGEMFFRGNLAFEVRLRAPMDSPELALGLEVPIALRPTPSGRGKGKGGGMMKMGGGRGGGMGGGRGGGMGGGGRGGGGSGMGEPSDDQGRGRRHRSDEVVLESEVVWVTIVLATQQG